MQRETASTTPVAADQVDRIALAVDSATAGVTYESVRGNVELSDEFMRDFYVHEFFASSDTNEAPAEESDKKPVTRTTIPEGETVPTQTEKSARSLGKTALNFLRGVGKKSRTAYYGGLASAVAALPGTKTKEELREQVRAQHEKYADKPDDGFFARKWNAVRRKKYETLAWTPVAAMGLAAFELYALRTAGYFHAADGLPPVQPQTRDWNNAIVVNPLPPVETHDIAPAQVAAAIDTPAPAPTPKPTAIKHIWTPEPEVAASPRQGEKPAYTGEQIVIPIGGATDPDGNIPAGMLDPNKVRMERIWYPAEMGPFVGATPTNISVGQGIDTVVNRVVELRKQNPNAVINLNGFSEGSFVARGAARRLQDMGIAVNVQTAGDPNTDIGILNNPLAEMAKPIMDSMGIQKGPEIDGLTSKVSGLDAWGGTATDDPGTMIGKFINIPKDHRIPTDAEIPVQVLTDGKETIKVYDVPIRVLPAGVTDITPGGPVTTLSTPAPAPEVFPAPAPEPALVDLPPVEPAPDFVPDMNQLPPPPPDPVGDWMRSVGLMPPLPAAEEPIPAPAV